MSNDMQTIITAFRNNLIKSLQCKIEEDEFFQKNKNMYIGTSAQLVKLKYVDSLRKAIENVLFKRYKCKYVKMGYFTTIRNTSDSGPLRIDMRYDYINNVYVIDTSETWNRIISLKGYQTPIYTKIVDSENNIYVFTSNVKLNHISWLDETSVYTLFMNTLLCDNTTSQIEFLIKEGVQKYLVPLIKQLIDELGDEFQGDVSYSEAYGYKGLTCGIYYRKTQSCICSFEIPFSKTEIKCVINDNEFSDDERVNCLVEHTLSSIGYVINALMKKYNSSDVFTNVLSKILNDNITILQHLFVNKNNRDKIYACIADIYKNIITNKSYLISRDGLRQDIEAMFSDSCTFFDDILTKAIYLGVQDRDMMYLNIL
jgi:hypothetical protein